MKALRHLGLWVFMCLVGAPVARAGFVGLEAELVNDSDSLRTYRLYATFASPTDELVALYGTANHPWMLDVSGSDVLFQSEFGGALGADISAAGLGLLPGLMQDSWWTVGAASTDEASNVQQAGMADAFAAFEAGAGFVVNSDAGGGLFSVPGSTPSAVAGDDLRVLIGQLTLSGYAQVTVNLQWRPYGGIMVHAMDQTLTVPENVGCTNGEACNYDASAAVDDGSCVFGEALEGLGLVYACDGTCLNDADMDGVCDELEVLGCTVPQASNFDPQATDDDGSCLAAGCTNPEADNYAEWATEDDGSCFLAGCTDEGSSSYNPNATVDDGSCAYPDPSFEGLVVETLPESGAEGVFAHQVFAQFSNAQDELIAVFGDENVPLTISAGTSFLQDTTSDSPWEGGAMDSWLSLGGAPSADIQSLGMEAALLAFEGGNNLALNAVAGGMWFVYPGSNWGTPDSLGRVLLGQFVSDGWVSVTLNLQYQAQSGATVQVTGATASFPDLPAGCLDPEACNYNASADIEDGSCDFVSCLGCLDEDACNYDATATVEDGSCVFAEEGLDCSGLCLIDTDGDGVCDDFEVSGCTNNAADNFNPSATDDDGNCVVSGCTNAVALNYDPQANEDDGSCAVLGCMDVNALNFDANANVEGPCDYPEPGFAGLFWEQVGWTSDSLPMYRVYAHFENASDDVMAVFGTAQHPLSVATTSTFAQAEGGSWWLADNATPAGDSWVTVGSNPSSQALNAIGMETAIATFEAGGNLEVASTAGGMWYLIPQEDEASSGLPDDEGRVLLGQLVTDGQVDLLLNLQYRAPNGSTVMVLGQSLAFPEGVVGCLDEEACNYDATADLAGECEYALPWAECDGTCLSDLDGDGVCDPLEVLGCTDSTACNWLESATDDDGSCFYATAGTNCDGSCNLDTDGDGVCEENEIVGCMDPAACNFDPEATDPGYCDSIEAGYNCDGTCLSDTDGDGVCDAFEVAGCTSPFACNFMLAATDEDGSCTFAESGYDCEGVCLYDADGDGVCDQDEVVGCTNANACNFNALATDEGTCYFPPLGFDCNGECVNDENNNGICDEIEAGLPCMGPDCCGVNAVWDAVTQTCIPLGPNLCGTGTVWDPFSQSCVGVAPCPADIDGNGYIALGDLLDLLAAYGLSCDE